MVLPKTNFWCIRIPGILLHYDLGHSFRPSHFGMGPPVGVGISSLPVTPEINGEIGAMSAESDLAGVEQHNKTFMAFLAFFFIMTLVIHSDCLMLGRDHPWE